MPNNGVNIMHAGYRGVGDSASPTAHPPGTRQIRRDRNGICLVANLTEFGIDTRSTDAPERAGGVRRHGLHASDIRCIVQKLNPAIKSIPSSPSYSRQKLATQITLVRAPCCVRKAPIPGLICGFDSDIDQSAQAALSRLLTASRCASVLLPEVRFSPLEPRPCRSMLGLANV